MKLEELVARFRSEVHDTALPYLWSDDEVFQYVNAAQNKYCRLTGGIADSTSVATRIEMVAGDEWGDVDKRVLKIRHAQRESDNQKIELWNFEDAEFHPAFDTTYNVPRSITLDSTQGIVSKMITGMEQYKVRWLYIPEVDDTALCIVYRLPLQVVSADNLADLEIPYEDHESLLDGMKEKAYGKEDAETFNKSLSDKHKMTFESYCEDAKHKRTTREHKYRTVRYGGI